MPSDLTTLSEVEVGYEEHPGWQCDISSARTWEDLPPNAQKYIKYGRPMYSATSSDCQSYFDRGIRVWSL